MKRNTRLDLYRHHLKCQHDGEVVLKAGERAFFPSSPHHATFRSMGDGGETNRFQSNMLLEQIGIHPEMTAAEITALIRRRLSRTVTDSQNPTGQEELTVLLQSVVDFCEETIIEKEG
ncbi:hypothetical protein KKA33_03800 [Patescibacteria group bacterium]|nr:hypothetical protein [Patescibacteria group bacterium]